MAGDPKNNNKNIKKLLTTKTSKQQNNKKPTYNWKLNNGLLNDNLVMEEVRKEL